MYTAAEVRRNNLLKLLQDFALKDRELAEKLGVTAGYLSQIKLGPEHKGRNIGHNTARKIEKVMGLTHGWLDDPHSINEPRGVYVIHKPSTKTPKNSVPLVTWEFAAKQKDPLKIHQNRAQASYIACPATVSKYAYALKVPDNSMLGDDKKSFPKNAIIFVDPSQELPIKNGDCIIAKVDGQKSLKLRLYVSDNQHPLLRTLNGKTADIKKPFSFYGKVIGTFIAQ